MGPERGDLEPLARATLLDRLPSEGTDGGGGPGAWQRRRAARVEEAFELMRVTSVLLWIVSAVLAAHAVTEGRADLHPWAVVGLLAAFAVHGVGRAWAAESLRDIAMSMGADRAVADARAELEVAHLEQQRIDTPGARTRSGPWRD